jgi:hypothetical protein
MGNVHAHSGRRGMLAVALMATVALSIMLAFMAVSAAIGTQDAQALPTFDTPVGGIGPCDSCHSKSSVHGQTAHVSNGVYNMSDPASCANCHPNGDTSVKPLPSKCGVCHGGVTVILAKQTHATTGCGTTPGCHGVPPAVATTTLTAKVAPTTVTVGKKVKVTGTAGPAASLAGAKVAFKVERKVGTKWVKMKAIPTTATASATGAFTWSYKTVKKGTHRVTMTIAATSTHSKKTLVKTFKVK